MGRFASTVALYEELRPVLGDRVDAMLSDIEQRLLPLSRNGGITEVFVSAAQVARR